jgi:hypothetical protein
MSWDLIQALNEAYTNCKSGFDTQSNPLLPCVGNKGYSPLTFVSVMVGVNIALSKWEPFRSSLLGVEKKMSEAMAEALISQKGRASLFADDTAVGEVLILNNLVEKDLESIRVENEKRWKFARRFATAMAWMGCIVLFLNLSIGIFGLLLVLPWAVTVISSNRSTKKIKKMVNAHVESLERRLIELRKITGGEGLAKKIDEALK